jgi:hypothetical protein
MAINAAAGALARGPTLAAGVCLLGLVARPPIDVAHQHREPGRQIGEHSLFSFEAHPVIVPLHSERTYLLSGVAMPRYIVERNFPDGFPVTADDEGAATCRAVVETSADHSVAWVHSYVAQDRTKTFCVYDAPSPEAVRKASARNSLPIDRITQVTVLDPYFYH